ncbi:vitellogenin-6-like isoform X2 [Tachypleus tridentatus]|uniref:vitellogenin-6-like isoform X2 n=1 Tax=Tachypleus tridentatus TaxID=6853 RepID=UPI003FD06FB3
MMRLYFLLSALAFIAGFTCVRGYVKNTEYHYHYHGQLTSGFPGASPQNSRLVFDSEVIIQTYSDYSIIKFRHFNVDIVNERVEDFEHSQYQFQPVETLTKPITKPFKIFFHKGRIVKFEVSRDEPEWAVNIKKGFMSIFHLDFEQNNPINFKKPNQFTKPNPESQYYRVMEDGIGGKCETMYEITSEPYNLTPDNKNVLNVTKSRNYERCNDRPHRYYSSFYGYKCTNCESEKTYPIHSNAFYYYNIRGNRHVYVIEHVASEGEVIFSPSMTKGETTNLSLKRTLHLKAETKIKEKINITGEAVSHYSLSYSFPHTNVVNKTASLRHAHYLFDVYGFKASVREIGKLIQELVTFYDNENYSKAFFELSLPSKFLELIRTFSTLGYDEIDEVYKTYIEELGVYKEENRRLFVETLSFVGTNPAFLYGKTLIETGKLPMDFSAVFILNLLYHLKEPSETLLDEFYKLCENQNVRQNHELNSMCYLALSSLVYEICVHSYHAKIYHTTDPVHCTPQTASKFFKSIVRDYKETQDEHYRLTYIKVAGNFGIKDAISYLKPYILGEREYPLQIRVASVWALLRLVHAYSEEVMSMVLPLYFNTNEEYELRIAAFSVFLSSNPPLYQLETTAKHLSVEPSQQVASFVYSTFYHLANSTHPCHKQISNDVKHCLRILEEYHHYHPEFDYTFSHNFINSNYEKKFDYGGFVQFAYIAGKDNFIPRSAYFQINEYMGGQSYDVFAVGYRAEGVENLIDSLFAPEGLFQRIPSKFDVFRRPRNTRGTSTTYKELKEINENVHIKPRKRKPVNGNFFIRFFNSEVKFFTFNESTFDTLYSQGYIEIPDIEKILRNVGYFRFTRFVEEMDYLYILPTEFGLPVLLEHKSPSFLHYHNNHFQFIVNPSLFSKDRHRKPPTEVDLNIDGHFVYDSNTFISLGIAAPFSHMTFGAGINKRAYLSLPIKMDFTVDLKNRKFHVKYTPVTPHDVFHYEFIPVTYVVNSNSNNRPSDYETTVVPVHNEKYLSKFELFDYLHDVLGVGFHVNGFSKELWSNNETWFKFLSKKFLLEDMHQFTSNPHHNPLKVHVAMTSPKTFRTDKFEAVFSYDYHGAQSPDHKHFSSTYHNYADEFDNYAQSRIDRKSSTYVLKAEVTAHGQRERKLISELTYSFSRDSLYHKFSFYFDRTPFYSNESENFKICMKGSMKYPHYDFQQLFELNTHILDHRVNFTVDMHFGRDCESHSEVTFRGHFDRTEEQRHLEKEKRSKLTHGYNNPFAYYYQNCINGRINNHIYNENCHYYVLLATQLRRVITDVAYKNIPDNIGNLTHKADYFLKYFLFPYMENNDCNVNHKEKHVHFEADMPMLTPTVDIRFYKPHEQTFFTHAQIPAGIRPLNAFPAFDYTYLQEYSHYFKNSFCRVTARRVLTFDQITYEFPRAVSDCYHIAARDCSEQSSFVILSAHTSNPKYTQAMKMLFHDYKIEVLPVSADSGLIVRVNYERVVVTEDKPFSQYVFEGGRVEELYYISFNGFYYTFHSDRYGFTVYNDGNAIQIELSKYYIGKQCGLCGEYNSDKHHELKGPEGRVYHNISSFVYSYAVPENTCTIPN